MFCVSVVRSVVVECEALKPCCVSERVFCVVIALRLNLFRFRTALQNNKISLYDEGSEGLVRF